MDTPVGNLKMDIPLGIVLAVITAVFIKFLLAVSYTHLDVYKRQALRLLKNGLVKLPDVEFYDLKDFEAAFASRAFKAGFDIGGD